MMSINEIRNHTFKLQRGGSYKAAEVDAFFDEVKTTLDALTSAYESAKKDNEELYRKMNVLADKIEEYRKSEDSIRATLLAAQKFADNIKAEAKENADKLVSDAQKQADETVNGIKKETDDYVITKKNDADLYAAKMISEADNYNKQKISEADELFTKAKTEYDEKMAQAEEKAQAIIKKAESEAAKVISDCEEKKAEMIAKANTQADEIVSNTQSRIEISQEKLNELKSMTAQFKASVTEIFKKEIEILDEITVNDNEYSAEYYPATFAIDPEAIYRPELTVEDENTADEEIVEETTDDVIEEEIQIIEEPQEEVIEEEAETFEEPTPVLQKTETAIETPDEITDVEDVEIIDEYISLDGDEAEEKKEEIPEPEIDFYEQLVKGLVTSDDSEPDGIEEIANDDSEGEPIVEKKEEKTSKNVFTKIDFFEADDEDEDIDISSGRTDLSSFDEEDELRFGTDYDIFGEDDDNQTSFFSKFKKK